MHSRLAAAGAVLAALSLSALAAAGAPVAAAGPIVPVVAAENEYASVAQSVGGPFVRVTAVMSNPNIDPHTYEASTAVAAAVAGAGLVIQNGVGYDSFMQKLEAASPRRGRLVLTVGSALGYGAHTLNPHLWYKPSTMPRVAVLLARDLSRLMPAHAAYFANRAKAFTASLGAWHKALAGLRKAAKGAPVAVTEPVADYMLQAAGLSIRTPWSFQAAVMNGTDPWPQDVATEDALIEGRKVKVLVYNRQAVDSVTVQILALARAHHVPVVGVYETMPPHLGYAAWMTAETRAVEKAIVDHVSTATLR